MRFTLIAAVALFASVASAQVPGLPFTVTEVVRELPDDVIIRELHVSSITDEAKNDGGIVVGDILLTAELPRGNRTELYTIRDLSRAVAENASTGIIWLKVRVRPGCNEVKHAKLGPRR